MTVGAEQLREAKRLGFSVGFAAALASVSSFFANSEFWLIFSGLLTFLLALIAGVDALENSRP